MNHASINNTIIEAMINGNFKFPNRKNALKFLENLREKFILAKNHEELMPQFKVKLWIRGYKVTGKEEEPGALGNYCMVSLFDAPDGTCRVMAEKESVPRTAMVSGV